MNFSSARLANTMTIIINDKADTKPTLACSARLKKKITKRLVFGNIKKTTELIETIAVINVKTKPATNDGIIKGTMTFQKVLYGPAPRSPDASSIDRSEERRVGKECRCRRSSSHERTKMTRTISYSQLRNTSDKKTVQSQFHDV